MKKPIGKAMCLVLVVVFSGTTLAADPFVPSKGGQITLPTKPLLSKEKGGQSWTVCIIEVQSQS